MRGEGSTKSYGFAILYNKFYLMLITCEKRWPLAPKRLKYWSLDVISLHRMPLLRSLHSRAPPDLDKTVGGSLCLVLFLLSVGFHRHCSNKLCAFLIPYPCQLPERPNQYRQPSKENGRSVFFYSTNMYWLWQWPSNVLKHRSISKHDKVIFLMELHYNQIEMALNKYIAQNTGPTKL